MSERASSPYSISTDDLPDVVARRVEVSEWFAHDADGAHLVDRYAGYITDLSYAAQTGNTTATAASVALSFRHAADDLNNLGVLIHRMDWIHRQSVERAIDPFLAAAYLALDVELFHVELRSLLDYCSRCIGAVASKPGQVPTSFRDLQTWVQNEKRARELLGSDLVTLVNGARWFPDVRGLRDAMVHRGGHAHVFTDDETILFQVYGDRWKTLVHVEHLMRDRDIVDFRLYSAFLFSELLLLVEELANALRTSCPVPRPAGGKGVRAYNLGFPVFLRSLGDYAETVRRSIP